ncbi:hypothetical protein EON65_09145 [archaeon]|nr:MAG: hypothetical protein EON65_09145 [archaeon]
MVQKRFDLVKDQSTKEISEFEIQLTRLRSENKDLSDQLAALKITLSSSHEVQHAQVLQTQATEAQQRQTIRDLEQRVRELDEMHNQIKELALQHGSNVVVLEQENVELQQQLSVEKSKCVGTNWKLQVKEQQHQAEKKALLEQLTDLHSKVEETNRMLLQKDTEMEDLQFTVASLQGKIDQSAKELEQIMLKHDHEAKRVQLQLDNLRQEVSPHKPYACLCFTIAFIFTNFNFLSLLANRNYKRLKLWKSI